MSSSSSSSSSSEKGVLRQFSLTDIKKATNNFDEALLIRRGGFGEVYKGTFVSYAGTKKTQIKTVAVRCFNSITAVYLKVELEAWSQYYLHKNVVPVIGYCLESGHNMVIYEYMSNGSLANHLCTKSTSSSFLLPSEQCLAICIDAARGLDYMHTSIKYSNGYSFCHVDVTATNILLDKNGVAKFSDLYKEPSKRKYIASRFDPFYHSTRSIPYQATDIYAFGVLLVKVLCRKVLFDDEDKNLGIWLHQCIMNGTINQMIHPDMKAQTPPDRLKAFVCIAGECLDVNPRKRPTSTELVKKLKFAAASSSQRLCHRYLFREIEEATNNFEYVLGEGGEGRVYKGKTNTGVAVAVKRLKPESSSGFEREIKILSTLDHQNLVSLIGYCHGQSDDQKILIYELMSNGNLQTALRDSSLSWDQRLNICIGAARGLRYLHTNTKETPKGIIHRDMKPANILLDENFDAKISDFGLSKMSLQDQTNSEMPTMLKGTRGYYAPEYQSYGQITRRIDVYAFGVILTEVLCGKRPWDRDCSFYPTENEEYSIWAKENVDRHLEGAISPSCLEAFTDILEKCLNQNPSRRPSMNDVVSVLENAQKWQEAWQRNDSGVLFHLPGVEDRVVLYYTSNSEEGTGNTFEDCLRVRLFLRRFGVPIDERDPAKDIFAKEVEQVFGNTSNLRLPKVFVQGKCVGGIEILNKTKELAKLLGVPSPKFVCKNCGEARSCNVCKREEWYVLCRNCDALTKVIPEEREGDLRSCLQCNGNQFVYKANLETQ